MKFLFYSLLILVAISCAKSGPDPEFTKPDTIADEYPEWYTLKAPVDHRIVGVWGNYDKTVLISTLFNVYRTTDKGRHWQQVHQQSVSIFGIVRHQDTLFTMNGLSNQSRGDMYQQILVNADNFSVDDGKTWQQYTGRNKALRDTPEFDASEKFRINPIIASNTIKYQINKVFRDGPDAVSGLFETPGVIKSSGERIDLPQLHQLESLYFDNQQRLYIAGSDAVCSRGETFMFCNSRAGRGVIYVSKKALP
ncbi:hypothetical protein [Dyadobacter sandarakinus]|uniref:BNR repeat-like domain-containing protein n=1 Tax=Dyadobacter sandarakinus TaxID=2747268 RepID=A0ABX7I4U8_9BACT|nr:hypothetical protein [Dyadobacter sandarakinus]QRR00051.1 hypothetical protein HWI92_03545 [Dyadobacter sandarakinus]